MDHLWTPWRFDYIQSRQKPASCIFCELLAADPAEDRRNFILSRDELTFIVLNRYPYTSGHCMIVVNRHLGCLAEISSEERIALIETTALLEERLRTIYRPDGFNVGFNIDKSAGAGVQGHLHLHIVPRWSGDANFVSVVGETRVVPEDLNTTFEKLSAGRGENVKNV